MKTCRKCGVELTPENWISSHRWKNVRICRACHNARCREWRARNLQHARKYFRKYIREWHKRNLERNLQRVSERNEENKKKVFNAYGQRCTCCGETRIEFLSVNRVDSENAQYRRVTGGHHAFYRWLVKNDFPAGFQVLCYNCSFARSAGHCPHELEAVACPGSV